MISRYISILSLSLLLTLPATAKIKVVTTLPDLASLARDVGGDLVTVDALVQPGVDPHHVTATPTMVVRISQADLFVVNGLDLEVGYVPALLDASRNQNVRRGGRGYVDASERVPVIEVPSGAIDRSMGDVHPGGNPHYLLDPSSAKWAAWNIANGLIRVDPTNADAYKARLKLLYARLDAALARAQLAMKPYRGSGVIVYHKLYNYLLNRLGLREAASIEPKPGVPPAAAHLAGIIASQKNRGIRIVVVEPWNDRRVAQQVASAIGATVVTPAVAVGSKPEATDVVTMFEQNVALLVRALGGTP
jgi:ABC-type Zn uptake system ZnuABC Zn-binding protein ZnuA